MKNNSVTYNVKRIAVFFLACEIIFWGLSFFIYSILSKGGSNESTLLLKTPELLFASLILIPFYGFYFWKFSKWNRLASSNLVSIGSSFFQNINERKTIIKVFLLRNTILFLIFALAHPFYGEKVEEGVKESMEVVIALDVSNSMNTKDIEKNTSRLDVAKRSLIQLINSFNGEKIGVCVFAGGAYVQLPLTNDYPVAKLFIHEIETAMLSNQGTNIDQAFKTSYEMFSKELTTKAIVLVTDGENHESKPGSILSKIKEEDIKVCVLGIGTKKGGLVPLQPNRPELGYKLGEDGNFLISKVNPSFIKSIAKGVDGYATLTASPFPNLNQLIDQIKKMKRKKEGEVQMSIKTDRYQFLLILSLLNLTAFFLMVFQNKNKVVMKLLFLLFIGFSSQQTIAQSWKDSLLGARRLYEQQAYPRAYEKYNRLLKIIPKNVNISDEVAQAAYKAEQYKAAEEAYKAKLKSPQQKPKASTYHNMGNSQMKQENYQGAIDSYKNALRLNPNDEETRYNLSEALRKLKQQQNKDQKDKDDKKPENKNNSNHNKPKKEENKKEDGDKKDEGNNQPSMSDNSVDKILDNLSKQEAKTKQKTQERKKGKGSSSTGKDW